MIPDGQVLLIVEDNEDDLFMLKRAFTAEGLCHVVRDVPDGEAAVHYFKGKGPYADRVAFPLPFLVLLDLKLPRLPGHDVLAWIRSQPEHAGVIVITFTSSREPADIARAYALGANAYLVKPSSLTELSELVRAIELFWIERNQFASRAAVQAVPPQARIQLDAPLRSE